MCARCTRKLSRSLTKNNVFNARSPRDEGEMRGRCRQTHAVWVLLGTGASRLPLCTPTSDNSNPRNNSPHHSNSSSHTTSIGRGRRNEEDAQGWSQRLATNKCAARRSRPPQQQYSTHNAPPTLRQRPSRAPRSPPSFSAVTTKRTTHTHTYNKQSVKQYVVDCNIRSGGGEVVVIVPTTKA